MIGSGDGSVSLTDLAVDILVHETGSNERTEAMATAAKSPEIFRELLDSHAQASDAAITAYLISKRRFTPDASRKLVRAFRDTMTLVNRASQGYNQAPSNDGISLGDDMTVPQSAGSPQVATAQGVTVMRFPLGGGIQAEVRFVGGEVQPSHIQTLEEYLKVSGRALSDPS
ncbi:MAG: hypothetical protein ACYCVL_04795 [Gemmatimonadaceae bacterium]